MGLPVILAGKDLDIGAKAIDALAPEVEVIHYVNTPDGFNNQVPAILKGETPNSDNDLGTKNYANKPVAVVLGSGLNEDAAKGVFEACQPILAIPWLKPDNSKPTPPLGPEYGQAMAQRVKDALLRCQSEGKLSGEGRYLY